MSFISSLGDVVIAAAAVSAEVEDSSGLDRPAATTGLRDLGSDRDLTLTRFKWIMQGLGISMTAL